MKAKNFPAKRLRRQMVAQGYNMDLLKNKLKLDEARVVRTKKDRSGR